MRGMVSVVALQLFVLGFTTTAIAQSEGPGLRAQLDIPAQDLRSALRVLEESTKVQLVFLAEDIANRKSQTVSGTMTLNEALQALLSGTGLKYEFLNSTTVSVTPAEAVRPIASSRIREGRVAQGEGMPAPRPAQNTAEEIAEVVVTAQKKAERLHEVPVPVTTIDGATLIASNQLRLQDYYARVPAMNFTQDFRGGPVLSIRGISSGALANPTIGIVVDDVPYGSSTSLGGGFTAPDFDPSDLARLEILRGPQGTLYGANSIGGLIKYVTIDPSTDQLTGRLQAGMSSVHHGDEIGYNVRGAVNVPVSDKWAVRASAFTRTDPGYIDNPVLGIDGVNRTDANGGRLSVLWRHSENFSLKLNALIQNSEREGSAEADLRPGLGELQQNFPRGTGTYEAHLRFYSATANINLGNGIELTSLSGYSENSWADNPDYSFAPWGGLAESVFGVTAASLPEDNETRKITQEVRLSMPLGERLDWLVGAFYTREKTDWNQLIVAIDPVTGAVAGTGLDYTFGPTTYHEYAAFTDLTIQMSDRFDVQLGARQSHNKQKHDEEGVYDFFGGFVFDPEVARTEADAFTYLVTPRFKISSDLMVYARLASGYRTGGPNYLTSATNFPLDFKPDKTQNYEVGVKGALFGRTLSYDASAYYIDWKDLQVIVNDPPTNLSGYVNAGRAKSQGIELSVESQPLTGLSVAVWVAWNDASLTEDFPQGGATSGEPLPYTSEWSGSLSLEQQFPVRTMTGFVGASANYVDDRAGSFTTAAQPQPIFPSYVRVDARAGLSFNTWTLNAFVNNLADRRGVLNVNPNAATTVSYIQPRTVGISLSREF